MIRQQYDNIIPRVAPGSSPLSQPHTAGGEEHIRLRHHYHKLLIYDPFHQGLPLVTLGLLQRYPT